MLAEPITQLIYRYQDAAVPPPYHRSIDIRIDAEKITLAVDSYGSILAKTEQDSPSDIMLKISNWIAECGISVKSRADASGEFNDKTTGNGIHFLKIMVQGKPILEGNTAAHDAGESARLMGDIETFAQRIRHCVDDFEQYVR